MKIRQLLTLVMIALVSMLVFSGCPKKAEVISTPEETADQQAAEAEKRAADEARAQAEAEAKARAEAEERERAAAAEEAAGLKPIYFDFDKAFIRSDAKAVLKANAEWLKSHPKAKVRIEGNCDERGTIEYNQALGQRRAASAKKYLRDLGIASSRISLISYGKEKPVCTENAEECWQQNRRDEFVAQ